MLLITEFKCEYRVKPLGIDSNPRFSYVLLSNKTNVLQETYQIIVKDNDEVMWDSGIVISSNSTNIKYLGKPLQPRTKYQVYATVSTGEETSETESYFETGKMDEKWVGTWIGCSEVEDEKNKSEKPICFKKEFKVKKEVKKARAYVTASGIYELYLQGKKQGSRYFAPGFTSYHKNLSYQSYDVTDSIVKGDNKLNVVVGSGWAVGLFGFTTSKHNFSDVMGLLLELHIDYIDGTSQVIKSDKNFLVSSNTQYQYADFYHGEIYDSRIGFDDLEYKPVIKVNPFPNTHLVSDYGVGVIKIKELKPVKVIITPKKEIVYDFGQNFAGVVKICVNGTNGEVIKVRHAEMLDKDGNFYTRNLRMAKASYEYICHDGYQEYYPHFTYMGFRYCCISGTNAVTKDDVVGIVLSSDMEQTSTFTCSNPLINKLNENIIWSARSNFFDIPTDCPQRDERLGWTGDITVFSRTGTFDFDMKNFIDKWLLDLRADQRKDGAIGHIVPYVKSIPQTIPTAGWSDAAIFVPWASYLAYGDIKVLVDNYQCMKKLVDCERYWAKKDSKGHYAYVFDKPFNFGDWLAPNNTTEEINKKTPQLGTAYFANSAYIVSKVATILGYTDDAIKYQKLFDSICKAYYSLFIDKDGKQNLSFQSAYVCSMYFKMFDEKINEKMASYLVKDVIDHDFHLTTGFLGTPFILFALCDAGFSSLAYDVLLQDTFPSWLYQIHNGATTIWERWDSLQPDGNVLDNGEDINNMVSFNHYALGSVGDFLYRRLAGLEVSEEVPGYKHFKVKPVLDSRFTYCEVTHKSLYGLIEVSWKIIDKKFILKVTVPVNTTATITLPNNVTHLVGSGTHLYKV